MTDDLDWCGWVTVEDGYRWQCVLTPGHNGAHLTAPDITVEFGSFTV